MTMEGGRNYRHGLKNMRHSFKTVHFGETIKELIVYTIGLPDCPPAGGFSGMTVVFQSMSCIWLCIWRKIGKSMAKAFCVKEIFTSELEVSFMAFDPVLLISGRKVRLEKAMFDGQGGSALDDISYSLQPSVLIAADSDDGGQAAQRAVSRTGLRLLDIVPLVEAADRLSGLVGVSVVMVEAQREGSAPALEHLVGRLDMMANDGHCHGLVSIRASMIDTVMAQISHRDMSVLCEPDEAERLCALALAMAPRGLRLNDIASEPGSTSLVQLSEEVGRIARALASLVERSPRTETAGMVDFMPPPPMTDNVATAAAAGVRALIRARRMRDQFFRVELFADPAWDMLLDLMAARLEHKRVSVSSLCIAAAVPATTALRWIKAMTDEGLFVRRADPTDGRRIFIELSDRTAGAMNAYLQWLKNNPVAVV